MSQITKYQNDWRAGHQSTIASQGAMVPSSEKCKEDVIFVHMSNTRYGVFLQEKNRLTGFSGGAFHKTATHQT